MTAQPQTDDLLNITSAEPESGVLPKYLNILYGNYEGSLPFDLNEELIEVNDLSEIPEGARPLPANQDGLFFCVGLIEDASRDDYLTCANEPSLAMFNAERNLQLLVYALDQPVQDEATVDRLLDIFEMDLNEGVPLPGQDGWEQVHENGPLYTADYLLDAYRDDPEDSANDGEDKTPVEGGAEQPADDPKKFFHALIKTRFMPEDYETPVKFMMGNNSKSMDWKRAEMPLVNLLAMLCQHNVGQKDGKSFVFADMVEGQRLKSAVKTVTAIGLDIDTGTPTEEIDAALEKLGSLAVRYSTHSHLTRETAFKRDEIIKFAPDAEIDSDLMRRYVTEKKHWHSSIAETVEYDDLVHEPTGIMVRIKHAPMPKNRIIVPLLHPYVIANEGKTQVEATSKWAKYPAALAAMLKLPFDPACTDPSRVFFLPRHDKSRPFSATIFGGPLFDLKSLPLDNPFDALANLANSKGKTTSTEAGKKLIPRYTQVIQRHMLADFLRDYAPETRSDGGTKFSPPCPFEGSHREQKPGDTAFYVMNAGDSDAPIPIAFCQHAGCQDYNVYDFVARMVEIEWFTIEELFDENYFPQIFDENNNEISPTPPDWVWGALPADGPTAPDESVGDDASKDTILKAIMSNIGRLTPKFVPPKDPEAEGPKTLEDFEEQKLKAVNVIIAAMVEARPGKPWLDTAIRQLSDRAGMGIKVLREMYDKAMPKAAVPQKTNGPRAKVRADLEFLVCQVFGCEGLSYPESFGTIYVDFLDGNLPYLFRQCGDGDDGSTTMTLCTPIFIAGGMRYADRDQEHGLRVYILDAKKECVTVEIPAQSLADKSGADVFKKLRAKGWAGGYQGTQFALEYLQLAQPQTITVHDTGGFKEGGYLFLNGESVPTSSTSTKLELSLAAKSPGPKNAGTMEGAKAATAALFNNKTLVPVQAGYLTGLAGIIAGAALDDTLFYEFFGPSTKGKTTAEQMGLSHHGDPRLTNAAKKQGGLLYDGDGTVNSFESVAKRCSSGAVAFDEWATPGAKANQRSVFSGYSGTGKRRQNRDTTDKTTASWGGGAILVSAERCLSQRLAEEGVVQLGGLTVRLLSIRVGPEHEIPKDEFKPVKALLDNYGHIGPAFVSFMIAQKWYNDPARIKARIEELQDELMEDTVGPDAQKLRASRPVAYLILAAEWAQEAGIVRATFAAKALAKTLWQAFLESDLAPIAPAKRGVETLVNWLLGNRDGEVHNYNESEDDRIKNRCPALAYYGARAHVPAEEGAKGAVYTADGWIMPNVPVYVVRADIIEEKAGGAVGKRELLEELEAQGKLARKPATQTQRTWNSFPRLGKVQYVVLRASEIDADADA